MLNYRITKDEIELAKRNGTAQRLYGRLVAQKIRAIYSIDAEFAVLRQKDEKNEEYAEYNAFVEACKAEAKAELEIE